MTAGTDVPAGAGGFDSADAVRAFAGDDCEAAYVPAQARECLTRFDERSAHYEVLLTPAETK